MAPGTKLKSKEKGTPGKAGVKKPKKRTFYFAFADPAVVVDLESKPLEIRQLAAFASPGKNELDVVLSLWELQPKGGRDRGKPFEIVQIKGKVRKADKFAFAVESVEQDDAKYPKRKNRSGTELWLPGKLKILAPNGKPVKGGDAIEVVLPPMEYDDQLELQLGCSFGESVCGRVKASWGSLDKVVKTLGATDKSSGVPGGGAQYGRPYMVVVHCMCAVNVAKSIEDSFDVDLNIGIFSKARVSAHFIVDRAGKPVLTYAVDRKAWHAMGWNTRTIGIELLGFADDFRGQAETKYGELVRERDKHRKDRDAIAAKQQKHEEAKKAGVMKVKVSGKNMDVAVAIKRCREAVEKLGAKLAEDRKPIDAYEAFTKDKDSAGVPLVYKYTDAQYATLGRMLEAFAKRFGYTQVASHHRLDHPRKKDPGKHFDWKKILAYLPPGKLDGDESGNGGIYKVD